MIFWSVSQALVEIDTQWNVNIKVYAIVCNNSSVEIDTQWNVNEDYADFMEDQVMLKQIHSGM